MRPGALPGAAENRRRWIAGSVAAVILALALVGGKAWWSADEKDFRSRVIEGGWPDLTGQVRTEGGESILDLTIGKRDLDPNEPLRLAPDHGKLLHFFLVRLPAHDAFAHLHPVRIGNQGFSVALPPLPEGDYEMLCDLTVDDSGLSTTATNIVHLLQPTAGSSAAPALEPDPDDSWAVGGSAATSVTPGRDAVSHCGEGRELVWKVPSRLQVNQDAELSFELRDRSGHILPLEPYMGMLSHVAVMRADGRVFAHLHPSGNFSMAAQMLAYVRMDSQANNDTAGAAKESMDMGMPTKGTDNAQMGNRMHQTPGATSVSVPYQFPSPGRYRLWVQVKSAGKVLNLTRMLKFRAGVR